MDSQTADTLGTAVAAIVVRMANEGIPVRAIARCTCTPSETIHEGLREAIEDGVLLQLPRDDWPPHANREERVPQYVKGNFDPSLLVLNVVRLFGVTQQQACLLLMLIKRREVTRKMLHNEIERRRPHPKVETEPKIVDVVICKLRKRLEGFGLTIVTVWSCGYYMPPEDRRKALDMLNSYLEDSHAVKIEDQITE